MFFWMELKLQAIIVILTIVAFILYRIKRKYDYWNERNVPHVGISKDSLFNMKQHRDEIFKDLYQNSLKQGYIGFYQSGIPSILVRDLDLIKCILIKEFSHFTDHSQLELLNREPLLVHNLFFLKGQRWKGIRNKLSPIFTSGKLRHMTGLLSACVRIMDSYLERTLEEKGGQVEMRDVPLKFSMDVMGVCAFGLDCKAVEDEDSEFKRVMNKLMPARLKIILMVMLDIIHPRINALLNLKFVKPEINEFFYSLAKQTTKHRAETATKRDDFVQLLMEVREEEQKLIKSQNQNDESSDTELLFTDEVIAANIWVFFQGGYDTLGTTMSYCLYELALHPDLQERLHEEIKQVQDKNGGPLTYDVLKQMHYLDCVVNETLRLHPALGHLERLCTKPCKVSNNSLLIEKGVSIIIPVQSLHLDPDYWTEPEKFDPDRFNEENKSKIVPGTYLPFGDGPRICIGYRFARMEMKAFLAFFVRKYSVHPTVKTEIPIIVDPKLVSNTPKNGIYLRFKKRD